MRQGADRAALKERRDDLYETPPEATRALLLTGELNRFRGSALWEPCAGRGAISEVLRNAGFYCVMHDLVAHLGAVDQIQTGIDFLMESRAWGAAIVTNPPYKLADEFIRHGLELGLPVIVLLRLMAIEGAARADLVDRHLVRVYAGIERLPMMHRDGWAGPKIGNSGAPFAWFVFEPEIRTTRGFEVIRISWRQ